MGAIACIVAIDCIDPINAGVSRRSRNRPTGIWWFPAVHQTALKGDLLLCSNAGCGPIIRNALVAAASYT